MATAQKIPGIRETKWTPELIKNLRGKRTQVEFGALLGVPKNTVWRWERGRACPDKARIHRLSVLAEQERFFDNWQLVGSMTVLADLEVDSRGTARIFQNWLKRSSMQLEV